MKLSTDPAAKGFVITYKVGKQDRPRWEKFLIPEAMGEHGIDYFGIFNRYWMKSAEDVDVTEDTRLWLTGQAKKPRKKSRFINSNMGEKEVTGTARYIAEYISLPNPSDYSGHSFRRSAASHMGDEGANPEELRSKFNWKSHKMCSVYVSSSKRTMLKNADLISGGGIATADGAPISKRPKEEPASSNTTVKEGIATAEEEVPTSKEVPSVKEEHTEVKVAPAADPKPGPSNPMEALKHAGFNITFNFNCK